MAAPPGSGVSLDLVGGNGSKHTRKGGLQDYLQGWRLGLYVLLSHGTVEMPDVQVVGAALPTLIYGEGAQLSVSPSTSTISDLSSCFSGPREVLGLL